MSGAGSRLRAREDARAARAVDVRCRAVLDASPELKAVIAEVDGVHGSTGAHLRDYVALFETVRRVRPRAVLECGTGRSTWIIAEAMRLAAEADPSYRPELVLMEHDPGWHEKAVAVFPHDRYPFASIHLSPVVVDGFAMIRGNRYRDVPEKDYEFVFVDSPGQWVDERPACNLDLVRVVETSRVPVRALIDNSKATVISLSLVFGPKVRYCRHWGLAVAGPLTPADLVPVSNARIASELFPLHAATTDDDPVAALTGRPPRSAGSQE